VRILQKETDLARSFKRIKKMGRLPFHSLRSFHHERPIFPLLLKQLLQKQRYTTNGCLHLKLSGGEPVALQNVS
jgi:hypothetical protein